MPKSPIENRIRKNLKKLNGYIKTHGLEAVRIYDHDIPEYPFFIEKYKDVAVVWERSNDELDAPEVLSQQRDEITEVLADQGMPSVIFKERFQQERKNKYEKTRKRHEIEVSENGLTFILELVRYVDTGLFLDHRPLRQWIQKGQYQRMLNLFCYTGSLSVAAAINGTRTTNVDLSKTYLKWAERNFQSNGLDLKNHQFINRAAEKFLQESHAKFDLIVLDPPTFSNSKSLKEDFDVQRDHARLIELCLPRLTPGGTLYFSTNRKKFQLNFKSAEVSISELSKSSIPPDFHRKNVHRLWKIEKRGREIQ